MPTIIERLQEKTGTKYLLGEPWPDDAIPGVLRRMGSAEVAKNLRVGPMFSRPATTSSWEYTDDEDDLTTTGNATGEHYEAWQVTDAIFVEFFKQLQGRGDPQALQHAASQHPEILRRVFRCDSGAVSFVDESWDTIEALQTIVQRFVGDQPEATPEPGPQAAQQVTAGNGQQPQVGG